MKFARSLLILLSTCLLSACSPHFMPPEKFVREPELADNVFTTFDGSELPLKTWLPHTPPKAVIIALHGFNDYSNFIQDTAHYFKEREIGVYAYDQRGFGASPQRGKWAGHEAMCRDLETIIELVKKRHPDVPLYLLGESMGGAVLLVADKQEKHLPVDGMILVGPAVWSRATMPFYQRWALWLGAHTVPWAQVTGEGFDIISSDNNEMLIALGRDPLVLKETRIDVLYGLTNLMDAAYSAAACFDQNALFLYGKKDEVIPPKPMADVFEKRLCGQFSAPQRLLVYENGYHMLLRDLQAEVVRKDIVFWLTSPFETFPSVREKVAEEITRNADIEIALRAAHGD